MERVAQLEDRLERLVAGCEKSQQQRKEQTSEKRRRAVQRAVQLSGSGGRSDVRRTLLFAHRDEKKCDGVGASHAKGEQSNAEDAIQDGWLRSESQLIRLLQHSDVRL